MPKLSEHPVSLRTKLLFIGESGSGKTGALASLADAGYNLRIVDLDEGVDLLVNLLRHKDSKYSKAALDRVIYKTLTEPKKIINGKPIPARATVWAEVMGLMNNWAVDSLGPVSSWGSNDILVIDSLTALGNAAYNFILQLNNKLMSGATGYENLRFIGQAQDMIYSFLEMLIDSTIKCNIIINSHVTFVDKQGSVRESSDQAIEQQGFPSALGRALSPKIPRLFNTVLLATKTGPMRFIETQPAINIGTKTSNPLGVKLRYPIDTGLAEYFAAVRSSTPTTETPKT